MTGGDAAFGQVFVVLALIVPIAVPAGPTAVENVRELPPDENERDCTACVPVAPDEYSGLLPDDVSLSDDAVVDVSPYTVSLVSPVFR